MPDLDPAPEHAETMHEHDDEEELAEAYEALDDYRQQQAQLAAARTSVPVQPSQSETAETAPEATPEEPNTPGGGESPAQSTTDPAPQGRRVFVIDGKEYPDPDWNLPITGTRSVQAMYRDYFPGQLENADVVQKTRADGTLEVTFRRRIGTKGLGRRASPRGTAGPGESVITVAGIAGVLSALPDDRPLAWELVEQAIAANGRVRLDYVPPAAQLNLAEAQQAARVRLIELAVGELCRLRPCL